MSERVVVLDDDPTGTQCASGVPVALDPGPAALAGLDSRALYVLTNTRAVDARRAARIVHGVRSAFESRAGETVMVLRGDSTLRGHVAAEMEALGLNRATGLIVPAYPAAGRLTLDGVHYLDGPDGRLNVADTEFARDPVFGFTSRTMAGWCREVGLRGPVVLVGLAELRSSGPVAVRDALVTAPDGAVVVPDAASDSDISAIARGFSAARAAGRPVVVRCAAPLAAAIAGAPGRVLAPAVRSAARILVVCGSHTAAATRQLERLAAGRRPVRILATSGLLNPDMAEDPVKAPRADLADSGLAIIATERARRDEHGTLDHAARVMSGLMRVVRALAGDADVIVSKGGITSAEVATSALGGRLAQVRGQIAIGIPLWDVTTRDGRVIPEAVVPGNVGHDATLADVCGFFGLR
jgi:uncharacterized protein YgbK (DUF1537 family)